MDRIKKLLDQEVQLNAGAPVPQALRMVLEEAKSDIPVRELMGKELDANVVLKGKLPVGAWIQAIEDTDPDVRVVIRDYGLLLTTRAGVPEGALRVQELWKGNYAELKKPDAPKQ
jgi:hypothetical protein